MIIIAAMSRDRVIGSGAGMPWSVPDEYAQFLDFVRGQAVIMGRTSYDIFGPDLTESRMFVMSRSIKALPGATLCANLADALAAARATGRTVYCAGGASVYRQALPLADAMYLSTIDGDYEGDAHFPPFDAADWDVAKRERHPRFDFVIYRRRREAE